MQLITQKLLEMAEEDQKRRFANPVDHDAIREIDATNIVELKKIITEYGWPTISKVGKDASQAAWLIAQHADEDVEFQLFCLILVLASLPDVSLDNVAHLWDRVQTNLGFPQIFGTQNRRNVAGEIELWPVMAESSLNERREVVGLKPIQPIKKW